MTRRAGRSRATIVILGSLAAVGPFSGDTYLPAFPRIAADLDASQVSVQLTLTASLLGLAVGQLVVGPLSDGWGRRRPLLAGMAMYVAASLGCAAAPSVEVLTGVRFLQGLAGAAAIVLARAVVRDLYTGPAAARAFSHLLLVFGVAPVVAPLLGGAVLATGHWRGIFLLLAGFGLAQLVAVAAGLAESLPVSRRTAGGVGRALPAVRGVLADRVFLGYALACGFAAAGMFAYIAGSPFVVQERYGAAPSTFAVLFAVNAGGLAAASHLNGRLVGRVPPARLLAVGVAAHAVGAGSLLGLVLVPVDAGLAALAPAMFVLVASLGLVLPNGTALALQRFPDAAGAASSVLGALHFALGASVAPLVGLGSGGTAVPFGVVIAGTAAVALLVHRAVRRAEARPGRDPAPVAP